MLSIDVGVRNLAYCVAEVDSGVVRFVDVGCVDVIGASNTSKDAKRRCVLEWVLEHETVAGCDVVVIEQQPRFNPTMVQVSHYLGAALETLAVVEGREVRVVYQPAKAKNALIGVPGAAKRKDRYKNAKRTSIEFAMACPEIAKHVSRFSKKDDVCDAVVQLLAYLRTWTFA